MLDETLNKVPLVSVDPDGTIKVNGSTSFKIYKNGRPNNSYSNNAKEIFKALPASMIQKIEVITDPGAREDAEGTTAILNIITVKNVITKGAMGNVGLAHRRAYAQPVDVGAIRQALSLDLWRRLHHHPWHKLKKPVGIRNQISSDRQQPAVGKRVGQKKCHGLLGT